MIPSIYSWKRQKTQRLLSHGKVLSRWPTWIFTLTHYKGHSNVLAVSSTVLILETIVPIAIVIPTLNNIGIPRGSFLV